LTLDLPVIELNGITWNHTRGYLPMVASAQRFAEMSGEVLIRWAVHSLQEFAHASLRTLCERYDLLVIDHPATGEPTARTCLLPLDEYVPTDFLREQANNSVGRSYESYGHDGHQWALAIDAAAPVSGFRADLLQRAGASVPRTWRELLELARRGLVVLPCVAVDSLMHFYMVCSALGEEPFREPRAVVSEQTGVRALTLLRELVSLCHPDCLSANPIAVWERLASSESAAYCPFAYGYSNYSRCGYGIHAIQFGGLVEFDNRGRCHSTLGGAGLAISARCKHKEMAVHYVQFVAGARCQRRLYFDSGGQPGHRGAWVDAEVNRRSGDFFRNTLATLDEAHLRPRFHGYLHFQNKGSQVVHEYLRRGGSEKAVIAQLNRVFDAARGRDEALI
jgi:multiple sugar transport system substrate-binding protein